MTFQDPSLIDDCSFHPCVRYNRYERDRVLSFVPPDGNFELCRYRASGSAKRKVELPLYCKPQIAYNASGGSVQIMVGTRPRHNLFASKSAEASGAAVEGVMVIIPFSKLVKSADLKARCGREERERSVRGARARGGIA
jgi:AP-3 complex subunit mu